MFYVSFALPPLPVFLNAESFNQTWCSEVWVTSVVTKASFSGTDNAFSFCCNPGKYYNISKRAKIRTIDVCDKCPQGQYTEIRNAETTCTSCPSGWSQNSIGKQFCLPCEPGQTQHLKGQENCTACELGMFMATAKSDTEKCDACGQDGKAGEYQNELGETNCKGCTAGKWNNVEAAVAESMCKVCNAGRYSSATSAFSNDTCIECPPGRNGSKVGASSSEGTCEDCSRGRYRSSNDQDVTTCLQCDKGQYQIVKGQASW